MKGIPAHVLAAVSSQAKSKPVTRSTPRTTSTTPKPRKREPDPMPKAPRITVTIGDKPLPAHMARGMQQKEIKPVGLQISPADRCGELFAVQINGETRPYWVERKQRRGRDVTWVLISNDPEEFTSPRFEYIRNGNAFELIPEEGSQDTVDTKPELCALIAFYECNLEILNGSHLTQIARRGTKITRKKIPYSRNPLVCKTYRALIEAGILIVQAWGEVSVDQEYLRESAD